MLASEGGQCGRLLSQGDLRRTKYFGPGTARIQGNDQGVRRNCLVARLAHGRVVGVLIHSRAALDFPGAAALSRDPFLAGDARKGENNDGAELVRGFHGLR